MIRDDRATTKPPEGRSSIEIREDIRRTRSDLDSTVDAIEERLSPGQLFDEAWHHLRRRRTEGGGGSAGRLVRDHPLPMALVGVGLGLLAAETMSGGDEPPRHRVGPGGGGPDDGGGGLGERLSDAGDRASEMKRSAGDALSGAGEQTRETAREAADRVRRGAEAATDRVKQAGDSVQHRAREVRRGLSHQMEENPLAMGAAVFALAVAAGSIFPSTRWEDEAMGEARDTVVDEARATGREALDDARDVASTAVDSAREEVEEDPSL